MRVVGVSGRPLRGRWLRELGASSAELAGVIVAAVCLVMALILPATGWGEKLTCLVNSAISQVGGGPALDCSSKEQGIDDPKSHAPTEPCVQSSRKQSVGGGVSVAVTVEADGGIIVEKLSDGTYRVTQRAGGKVAAEVGVGGGAQINWGDKHFGGYASASAGVGGAADGGITYVVNSEQAKNDLVDHLVRHMAVDAVGGQVVGWGVNWVWDKVSGYTPPAPTEAYLEVGPAGSASAKGTAIIFSGEAKADLAGALGVKVNREKNTVTAYYKVNLGAGVSAGNGLTDDKGKLEGNSESLLEVTFNAEDGSVLSVSNTGSWNGEWAAALDTADLGGDKGGQVYTATLDTSTLQGRQAAYNMLRSVGIPVPGSGNPGTPAQAFQDMVRQAASQGGVTRRKMVKDGAEYGFDFDIKALLDAGLSAKYTDETVTYSDGEYLYNGKWYKWEGC